MAFFSFIFYHLPAQKSWCFELWNLNHPCFRKETSWCFVFWSLIDFEKKHIDGLYPETWRIIGFGKKTCFEFWDIIVFGKKNRDIWILELELSLFSERNIVMFRIQKPPALSLSERKRDVLNSETSLLSKRTNVMFWILKHHYFRKEKSWCFEFWSSNYPCFRTETSWWFELWNFINFEKKQYWSLKHHWQRFFLRPYGWKSNYSTSSRKKIRIGNFPIGTLVCFFQLKSL